MKKKIFSLLILLALFITIPVQAKEINDFHAVADDNVKFEDTVNGDSAIAGNIIDMLGNIDGIGFIAGNNININGNLEYGFIAGQNIKVNSNITKNIYAAGNTITFTKNTTVGRDVIMVANEMTLNGKLERNINISTSKLTIEKDAIINGNINIDASEIIIQDGARIEGTLNYNKNAKTTIGNKVLIGKVKTYENQNTNKIDTTEVLQSVLNMIIVFLSITLLIPQVFEKADKEYEKKNNKYIKNIAIGFLVLLCVPITALLLLMSNIGTYLGLIIAAIYAIALYLSFIVAGYILGTLLLSKILKLKTNKYLTGIIGILLLKVLMIIPVLGTILAILSLTIGLGTMWNMLWKKEESNKKQENKEPKETKVIEAKTVEKQKKDTKTTSKKNNNK